MNILTKLMMITMCISMTLYIILNIKSIKYSINIDLYSNKAGILFLWMALVSIIEAVFKIKNSVVITIFLLVGTIINVWVIFTKFFEKQKNKAILYDELFYTWGQPDLTNFKNHMNREKQIEFLKSIKMNKESTVKENGKPIIEQILLINNNEDLKKYEPILKKEKKEK